MSLPKRSTSAGDVLIYRHPLLVRIAHWVSALCMFVLFLSGLQILNAHPAFYWGDASTFAEPWVAIVASENDAAELRGEIHIGSARFDTTGFLGASSVEDGPMRARAMPSWLTLPSYPDLGAGRAWHFFFAWVLVITGATYLLHGAITRRLRSMLWPTLDEVRGIGRAITEHLQLRRTRQGSAHYNVLQKLAYLIVLGILVPMMVLTGFAMSPAVDAVAPVIVDMFGGRQSARTLHFLTMLSLLAFVAVHLLMVIIAGPLRELRAIVTGWYLVKRDRTNE